jgi:hypothetical protein
MNPTEVEQARRILRTVHQKTVEGLVSFVLEHEDPLLDGDRFDNTSRDRLAGFQQELFVLAYLLSSLPAPAPVPAPVKPPVENGS